MVVGTQDIVTATGRRKSAVARVRLARGSGQMLVNGRDWRDYFPTDATRLAVRQPLIATGTEEAYDIWVSAHGGGPQGQADAIRHGVSRALIRAQESFSEVLREQGYLTRDARVKERKKYGQRGARARFQFSKR